MSALPSFLLSTLLASSLPAMALQATPAPKAAPAPEPDPDLALLKAMRSKVFILLHRNPVALVQALDPLRSGSRASKISWADRDGLNVISVRDFPENLAVIEEAIKRLDVPAATQKAPDVELTIHVLLATKTSVTEAGLPEDLQGVVKQLKGTLAYRGYVLAATFVQRVGVNGDRPLQGRGQLDSTVLPLVDAKGASQLFVDWESDRGVSLEPGDGPASRYVLRKFQFRLQERRGTESGNLAGMETGITLKEGDKVVVGTSVVKDHGVIVVLTARRAN